MLIPAGGFLQTTSGGRDIGHHFLVPWPDFHLPYYHLHPELSSLCSPCLIPSSAPNVTCCLCNTPLCEQRGTCCPVLVGPSLEIGKGVSCLYVYLKLCWGLD